MSLCRDGVLRSSSYATNGALLTLGKTGLGTRCILTRNDIFGMTISGDSNGFAAKFFVTNRTINYIIVGTCSCTSRLHAVFYNNYTFFMTKSTNCNSYAANLLAASCTINYIIVRTIVFTIRSNTIFYNDFASLMTKRRNCLLCNENLVTYGAVLTFSKTGFDTGRSLRLINYLGVTLRRNFICYVRVTAITGICCITCRSTSRSSYYCFIFMSERANYFLSNLMIAS